MEEQVTWNKGRFAFQNKTGSLGAEVVQVPNSEKTGNNSGTREQDKRTSTPVLCHKAQPVPLSRGGDWTQMPGSWAQLHQISSIPEVRELLLCHTTFSMWEAKTLSRRKVLFAKDPPSGLKAAGKPPLRRCWLVPARPALTCSFVSSLCSPQSVAHVHALDLADGLSASLWCDLHRNPDHFSQTFNPINLTQVFKRWIQEVQMTRQWAKLTARPPASWLTVLDDCIYTYISNYHD